MADMGLAQTTPAKAKEPSSTSGAHAVSTKSYQKRHWVGLIYRQTATNQPNLGLYSPGCGFGELEGGGLAAEIGGTGAFLQYPVHGCFHPAGHLEFAEVFQHHRA